MTIELDSTDPRAVDGRQIRAVSFHDLRMDYLAEVLGSDPAGGRALVVGGGRGVLSRGIARLGFDVVSLDPSPAATDMARADDDGLGIEYRTGRAEALADEGAFDLVYVADIFEVASDLDRVVERVAAALAPGGVLVYDTVSRSVISRVIYLGLFQLVPATRIMPRGRYSASRLRTPAEMAAAFARHGLRNGGVAGFAPKDPRKLLTAALARKRGDITDADIPGLVGMVRKKGNPPVTYLGHARRA
ncbi:methyltransferase domain-containing protein [Actinomycetes bacterium KLBMP 9759]